MKDWYVEPLKNKEVFIVPLAAMAILLFGLISTMVHVFKVPPEKLWIYRKSSWARRFIDSEIEHVLRDKAYRIRAIGGGIVFLFIGTVATIICIINLINYISGSSQNLSY